MIVVDASALLEWLLGLPRARQVGQRLSESTSLHAPALIDVEVAQVVRRGVARGDVAERLGERVLSDLADLEISRYDHVVLLPSIWKLRHTLTAYDGAYVALASLLDAPLITLDARLARAPLPPLPGREPRIDLIT